MGAQPQWSFWRWPDSEHRLRQLWSQGLSASQIAARLTSEYEDEVSRNAIISKAHRMGLPGRPSPIKGYVPGVRRHRRGARAEPETTLQEFARPRPVLSAYSPRSVPAVDTLPLPAESPAGSARVPPVPRAATAPLPVSQAANPGEREGGGRGCQWILDRDVPKWPGRPRYCGAPAIFGESWCSEHRARVFIPKAERLVDKGRLERLAAAQ